MSENDPKNRAEEARSQAEHRLRMRTELDSLIEDLIQDGKEQGVFDNLKNKGKPLNLKRNLYAPDKELAFELLKQNDLPPAWILQRNHIKEKTREMREEIGRQWQRHGQAFARAQGHAIRDALTLSWDDACRGWAQLIEQLNKEIELFNLKRPFERLEIYKLDLERELKRQDAPRYLR